MRLIETVPCDLAVCVCRQGLLRGMPSMLYYMAQHTLSGRLGRGPKYTVVVLQHQADKGLDKVGMTRQLPWCCHVSSCLLCHQLRRELHQQQQESAIVAKDHSPISVG